MSQWELASEGARGNQGCPYLVSWAPEDLPTKCSFETMTMA